MSRLGAAGAAHGPALAARLRAVRALHADLRAQQPRVDALADCVIVVDDEQLAGADGTVSPAAVAPLVYRALTESLRSRRGRDRGPAARAERALGAHVPVDGAAAAAAGGARRGGGAPRGGVRRAAGAARGPGGGPQAGERAAGPPCDATQ